MVGPLQKVKDALTGHSHRGEQGATAYGTGSTYDNSTAGYSAQPSGISTQSGISSASDGMLVGEQPVAVTRHTETVVTAVPQTETVSTGYTGGSVGREAVVHQHVQDQVCSVREFVEVEDRPVVKERVERVIEHNPVEKRYVVETRPVGETLLAERSHVESVGVTERVIDRAEGQVCPTATAAVPAGATVTNSYNACADGSCNRI